MTNDSLRCRRISRLELSFASSSSLSATGAASCSGDEELCADGGEGGVSGASRAPCSASSSDILSSRTRAWLRFRIFLRALCCLRLSRNLFENSMSVMRSCSTSLAFDDSALDSAWVRSMLMIWLGPLVRFGMIGTTVLGCSSQGPGKHLFAYNLVRRAAESVAAACK